MQQKTGGQVYAELLCDFMFKRLFGSEENKDVFFIPTEHLGLTELDRKAIFDISCRCSDGSQFIIEIQKDIRGISASVPFIIRLTRSMSRVVRPMRGICRNARRRIAVARSAGTSISGR